MSASRDLITALVAVALVVAVGCAKKDQQEGHPEPEPPPPAEPSLAERFADHAVFAAGELADAELSIQTADGEPTAARPIRELELPDSLVLLPPAAARRRATTVGELAGAGIFEPLALNCSTKNIWENETRVINTEACIAAPELATMEQAAGGRQLASGFSGAFSAAAASTRLVCFPVTLTVTGNIECENSCNDADNFFCTMISSSAVFPVDQPERNADKTILTPCNTKNTCTGS